MLENEIVGLTILREVRKGSSRVKYRPKNSGEQTLGLFRELVSGIQWKATLKSKSAEES